MGMLDAPGYVPRKIWTYQDFTALIPQAITAQEIDDMKNTIIDCIDITDDEVRALLALFPPTGPGEETPESDTDKQITTYQQNLMMWYRRNYIYISLVQWLIIIFIVIKISNK
jgi:hypothetical protein